MRHARMLSDQPKAPAFGHRVTHRGNHRSIDNRRQTRTQRNSEPNPLRRSQPIKPIAEAHDVSPQETDPRILIHRLRMSLQSPGVKSFDTYTGFPFRSYPTPSRDCR